MKFTKTLALAGILLFSLSCNNDDDGPVLPKGAFENGYLITNEGNFGKPNASVSFLDAAKQKVTQEIFSASNNGSTVGNVLQTIGFSGDDAYLVVNASNKIEIVNRYTFAKKATVTSNLSTPRYIAFSGSNYYVTNHNFDNIKKLNVYSKDNAFVKSIDFERYAEKVVEAGGYIYVQSDGLKYDANYNPYASGHTITRVSPATNAIDKTITLTDNGVISDLVSANGIAYALSSDASASYVYKINGAAGTFEKVSLSNVKAASRIAVDNNQVYLLAGSTVYTLPINSSATTGSFATAANYPYSFNVIDGNIFISDPDFMSDTKLYIYNTSGTLQSTVTAGVGTNGVYKN